MPSYDPPAAQYNDHSQICHSKNIIESHNQTTRANTYTSAINELMIVRNIEQVGKTTRWHNTKNSAHLSKRFLFTPQFPFQDF